MIDFETMQELENRISRGELIINEQFEKIPELQERIANFRVANEEDAQMLFDLSVDLQRVCAEIRNTRNAIENCRYELTILNSCEIPVSLT